MEIRPNAPFRSPVEFEEIMHEAVLTMQDFLQRKYQASLLGTGMHPFLKLDETGIWPHRHKQIYSAYSKVFNLKRHGWLNIQSFQLNLPYSDETSGILLHNMLAVICTYLPAIAASSPVYEGKLGDQLDNRLGFYMQNQIEIPSVTGDVIPEYYNSFDQYRRNVIDKYSAELIAAGADPIIVGKEWVNSRGAIFRFDRTALEIRVMDEQECIKSDVAFSCFVRALLRGMMEEETELLPHEILVKDFGSIVMNGLDAEVHHPCGSTARQVCRCLLRTALKNASDEEKKYLPLIARRIEIGSLSEIIRAKIAHKTRKVDFKEATVDVYSNLMKSLIDNQPYS